MLPRHCEKRSAEAIQLSFLPEPWIASLSTDAHLRDRWLAMTWRGPGCFIRFLFSRPTIRVQREKSFTDVAIIRGRYRGLQRAGFALEPYLALPAIRFGHRSNKFLNFDGWYVSA
jgi:hypothetical protein